jgi:transposase-like protein
MRHTISKHSAQVLGPDGGILTPLNLPPTNTVRWVARRKAEVIAAVHGGLLSMAEACRRYSLSSEEFLEWERHYKEEGLHGLRASARHPHQQPFH